MHCCNLVTVKSVCACSGQVIGFLPTLFGTILQVYWGYYVCAFEMTVQWEDSTVLLLETNLLGLFSILNFSDVLLFDLTIIVSLVLMKKFKINERKGKCFDFVYSFSGWYTCANRPLVYLSSVCVCQSLPFTKIAHSITAQDHQPTPDCCILSMVVGQLKVSSTVVNTLF